MSHSQLSFEYKPIASLANTEAELAIRLGGRKLAVACAVDGSSSSDRACAMSARLANSTSHKHLILHVEDPASVAAPLPKHLQPRHLAHYYEGLSMSFRVPESHWICKEKESESESTCRALTNLAERSNTDILVLGNCGAKHVSKATLGSSTSGLPPLGSVTAGAIRESHASICIVRANSPLVTPNQRLKFVFCTDGSHASAIGFCLLVGQIARPRDTVDVVTVTSGDGDCERQLMDQYQQYLKAKGVEGEARIKTINLRETTVSEGIISAAEEAEADILVLGIANYGQVKLGSMSDYAVRHCPTTVLILKDSAEVSAGRSSRLMGAQDELMRSNTLSRSTSMQRRATSDSFDLPSFQRMTADIKQTMHNLPTIPSLTFLEINS